MEGKKRSSFWLSISVIFLASTIGLISQYPALVNEYVINGDIAQHTYWMQQFRDGDLFRDDVLTEFAKSIQPYGLILLYRFTSLFSDLLWASKILPILLFAVSALYMFRLAQYIGGELVGILAAFLFMTLPMFMETMAGGTARVFAYPLIIIFLYYLITKDYLKACVVLILQALFYPIVFCLSLLTYLLTFFDFARFKLRLQMPRLKLMYFIPAATISVAILSAKYYFPYASSIPTSIVTREQMVGRPEYSEKGRFQIIPVPSITKKMIGAITGPFTGLIKRSPIYLAIRYGEKRPAFVKPGVVSWLVSVIATFVMVLLGVLLLKQVRTGELWVPIEFLYLMIASVAMYKIADWFIFKFYIPERYLQYSIPVMILILVSLTTGRIIEHIKQKKFKTALMVGLMIVVLVYSNINIGIGLQDYSGDRKLYQYLNSLPKNTLIAAHPAVADYVPTFSKRKVFINLETSSHTWSPWYWGIIKARTQDFFYAYYASEQKTVFEFCKKHNIDYLVIDKRHFSPEYLSAGNFYFEPFNTYITKYVQDRKDFALLAIPGEDKFFVDGDIFVISVDALMHS